MDRTGTVIAIVILGWALMALNRGIFERWLEALCVIDVDDPTGDRNWCKTPKK